MKEVTNFIGTITVNVESSMMSQEPSIFFSARTAFGMPPSLGESPSPRRTPMFRQSTFRALDGFYRSPSPRKTQMSQRSTLRASDGWASRSGLTVAWNPLVGS